ncbi:MAG: ATP-grasp domain-containing protein [Cyanobacteria bacterium P01_G01_bin.39]
MELLEYQAKELFRTVGIPVLPSQTIQDSRQIKQLQIPYPVVLKSQVSSGGRGKAGGVRFVANTIDAIAAARSIFNLSILGEYPEVILAEAHYNTERELFLAIVLDYDLQCPVLLGSAYGGMNVNSLLSNLQQVVVDAEFSLFYARKLAASMGLSGKLICSVSKMMAKMYRLFQETDLDLIEINPLGVNNHGELMALDGKITINDHALARQPIIETLNFSQQQIKTIDHNSWKRNKDFRNISWRWLNWYEPIGKIAMICSSFDAALLTWDLLKQNEVIPACSALIENSLREENSNLELYRAQLWEILAEIDSMTNIKAVVFNIWEPEVISREIINTLIGYCDPTPENPALVNGAIALNSRKLSSTQFGEEDSKLSSKPYFILRLLNPDNLEDLPETEQIYLSSNLEQVIELVKRKIKA